MSPNRFREIRTELNLKQEELAEILCVSHPMVISHYETGFRKPSKLIQVVMSILSSLPKKKRDEFIELIRDHVNVLSAHAVKGSRREK